MKTLKTFEGFITKSHKDNDFVLNLIQNVKKRRYRLYFFRK